MSSARAAQRQAGFTLIEILLVVVIVGVVMGVAIISLNPEDAQRRMLRERDRLQAQLQYAHVLAESNQYEVGLRLYPEGYEFLRYDARHLAWLPLTSDPALKVGKATGLDFTWLDGDRQQNTLSGGNRSALAANMTNSRQPDLIVLSSGEATPGTLRIYSQDNPRATPVDLVLSDIGTVYPAEEAEQYNAEVRNAPR